MSTAMARTLVAALSQAGMAQALLPSLDMRQTQGECVRTADGFVFPDELHISSLPSSQVIQAESYVDKAEVMSVKYGNNFKVLTDKLAKEQYILTQCGTTKPTDAEVNAVAVLPANFGPRKHFTIPIQSAVASSTVQLGFVNVLGVEDRFTHVSQYATGACWQKGLACGAKLDGGGAWGNQTLRDLQLKNADVAFLDCKSIKPLDCSNVRKQSNGVHFSATQDAGNVHSAEYVKFLAAFFNKEKDANDIFADKLKAYTNAAVAKASKPIVAWITSPSSYSKCFGISQATYKRQLVEHAGGVNKDMSAMKVKLKADLKITSASSGSSGEVCLDSFKGSLSDTRAAFFGALTDVDFFIDENYAAVPAKYKMSSFLEAMNLTVAPAGTKILRIDGTISENNGLDWYESRVSHPDWAVNGLVRLLHSDSSKPFKYFRSLTSGELPQIIKKTTCTKDLPVCTVGANPASIPVPMKAATKSTTQSALKSTTKSAHHGHGHNSSTNGSASFGFRAALGGLPAFAMMMVVGFSS